MASKPKYLKGKSGRKRRVAPEKPFTDRFALEVPNPDFNFLTLDIPEDGTLEAQYSDEYTSFMPQIDHSPRSYEEIMETEKEKKHFNWGAHKQIYIWVGQLSGLVKIGHSKNTEKRLIQAQSASGETIFELAILDGDRVIERLIHGELAYFRHHGEWYYPAPQVLAWVTEAEGYGGY